MHGVSLPPNGRRGVGRRRRARCWAGDRCGRGLLFDADGVLVDSDGSIERSWVRWAHRWDHDPATVLAGIHGRRSDDTVALLVDHADRARALADIDRYEQEDVAAVTACPGAAELLASLPAGAWAVVT